MSKSIARTAATFMTALLPMALHAEEPRVVLPQGELRGASLDGGGTLFAGIPYAAPPVGQRRWQSPAPAASWTGVRDATTPGPTCPQPDIGWNRWDAAHSAEDCLNLNVWTPPSTGKARPVMVWFHGGAFLGGSGSVPTYNGVALSRQGVVIVTLNYRLGLFGFLAHPELSAETGRHVSGNYAVQDQVAALAWVHRNIARFGGDPNNVTIFGQSAGSISAANLITIPEARRYFKRAILQSGTPFGVGQLPTLAEAEKANAGFGKIADLRALSPSEAMARWARFAAGAPQERRVIPVVDGQVLARQPATAYLAGAARKVPLLLGSVVREIPPANKDDLVQTATRSFGSEAPAAVADYEARGSDPIAGDAGTQMMTDMLFRCGTIATAKASSSAWLYHFFEDFPGRPAPAHSAEVFYVFDSAPGAQAGPPPLSADQRRLSQEMIGYWTNFAKTGDPNGAGLPSWPRYSEPDGPYVELAASGVKTAKGLRRQECAPLLRRWAKP